MINKQTLCVTLPQKGFKTFNSMPKDNPSIHLMVLNTSVKTENLDICVSDCGARAVVAVNEDGKLRFRYTGSPSTTKGTFSPVDIIRDSQSQIMTADCWTNRIHILDQNGNFSSTLRIVNGVLVYV